MTAISPQSVPSTMTEMDADAPTSILRKYSIWTGDTARVTAKERSSGSGTSSPDDNSGTVSAATSAMIRNELRKYSALA